MMTITFIMKVIPDRSNCRIYWISLPSAGTYRLNQLNCTNQFQETCELYEPKAIICFHNYKGWDCQATQTMEVTVKNVKITCEPYPFSPERSMNGYVVRDSCYLNYELVREPNIFTNFNGIFIFYLISIVFSITFLSLAFKNRGSLKYSQFGNHQYFKLKTDEDDEWECFIQWMLYFVNASLRRLPSVRKSGEDQPSFFLVKLLKLLEIVRSHF